MTAKRLLELSAEYLAYEEDAATLKQFGQTPDRTPDDIAAEYGRVLREFLSGEDLGEHPGDAPVSRV